MGELETVPTISSAIHRGALLRPVGRVRAVLIRPAPEKE